MISKNSHTNYKPAIVATMANSNNLPTKVPIINNFHLYKHAMSLPVAVHQYSLFNFAH